MVWNPFHTMKQTLRNLLGRPAVYLAVAFPHPFTIALMCRLHAMPYDALEVRHSLIIESDEPLDMS